MNRRTAFYILVAFVAAIFPLTYWNHFHNAFHFDDSHTIVNNVYIRDLKNIPQFFKDGTTFSSLPTNQSYRPLVTATLAIDYALQKSRQPGFVPGKDAPVFFHVDNFIFFGLQGALMFFLFLKLFERVSKQKHYFAALFAAALYLLHPAMAETVNYIIARSDLLSTFFVILGLVMYQYSALSRKFLLYLVPVVIGSLAKPPAVMFAPLLFFYVLLFEKKMPLAGIFAGKNRPQLISAIRISLPAFLVCGAMYLLIQKMEPSTWVSGGTSRFYFFISQPFVILHYFTTFFLPTGLSADTDWTAVDSVFDIRVFAGLAFVAVLFYLAVLASRKEELRPVSFGILWFFIALIPSSSIVPLAEIMNDHRIFFPFIGLAMSVCWYAAVLLGKANVRLTEQKLTPGVLTAALVILSAYAYGTRERNKVWLSEETLWKDVTEKSPKNGRGQMNYGLEMMSQGKYDVAEKYFSEGLRLWPNYSYLHINMGILKDAMGKPAEAEPYFINGINNAPNIPNPYFYYGRFLKKQNRIPEAVQNLKKAIGLSAAHLDARYLLMTIYYEQSDFEALTRLANETLQIVPDDQYASFCLNAAKTGKSKIELQLEKIAKEKKPEDYLELSLMYYNAGQFDKCIEAANNALQLKPDYAEAYNNIAAAYGELHKWDEEIAACEKALKLKPDFQLARNNLAWASSQKNKK